MEWLLVLVWLHAGGATVTQRFIVETPADCARVAAGWSDGLADAGQSVAKFTCSPAEVK